MSEAKVHKLQEAHHVLQASLLICVVVSFSVDVKAFLLTDISPRFSGLSEPPRPVAQSRIPSACGKEGPYGPRDGAAGLPAVLWTGEPDRAVLGGGTGRGSNNSSPSHCIDSSGMSWVLGHPMRRCPSRSLGCSPHSHTPWVLTYWPASGYERIADERCGRGRCVASVS